jgi:hypothetical protein
MYIDNIHTLSIHNLRVKIFSGVPIYEPRADQFPDESSRHLSNDLLLPIGERIPRGVVDV